MQAAASWPTWPTGQLRPAPRGGRRPGHPGRQRRRAGVGRTRRLGSGPDRPGPRGQPGQPHRHDPGPAARVPGAGIRALRLYVVAVGPGGTNGASLYSATKFGLRGFAGGLRADLHGSGIGVSVMFPGFVREAGMFADTGATLPPGVGTVTPEAVADAVVRAIRQEQGRSSGGAHYPPDAGLPGRRPGAPDCRRPSRPGSGGGCREQLIAGPANERRR